MSQEKDASWRYLQKNIILGAILFTAACLKAQRATEKGKIQNGCCPDCLTVSMLCLMAPCRKLERQHCTTLSGLQTRPHCIWWTSLFKTGTFSSCNHNHMKWEVCCLKFLYQVKENCLFFKNITTASFKQPLFDLSLLQVAVFSCLLFCALIKLLKHRGKLSTQLSLDSHKANRNGSSTCSPSLIYSFLFNCLPTAASTAHSLHRPSGTPSLMNSCAHTTSYLKCIRL